MTPSSPSSTKCMSCAYAQHDAVAVVDHCTTILVSVWLGLRGSTPTCVCRVGIREKLVAVAHLCEPILLPSGTISQGCQAGCTAGVVHHHLTLGVTHAAFAVTVAGILASKSDVDGKLI
eukprot:m.142509 g.142509  ORF g.142509 m.142509 type:complete len:119 (+) comp17679_c0_seq4:1534-1890(+)